MNTEQIETLLREAISLRKAHEGENVAYVHIAPMQVALENAVRPDTWKSDLIGLLFLEITYHSFGHDLSRSAKLLHHIIYEL